MEDDVTITVRIPSRLKDSVQAAIAARGMTLAGWVRKSLEDSLRLPYVVWQIPGLDPSFDRFMDAVRQRQLPKVLIMVDDRGGNRAVYRGYLNFQMSSDSVIGIRFETNGGTVLLRRDIVGWLDCEGRPVDDILSALRSLGWHVVDNQRNPF
jgi:hypothetical protein